MANLKLNKSIIRYSDDEMTHREREVGGIEMACVLLLFVCDLSFIHTCIDIFARRRDLLPSLLEPAHATTVSGLETGGREFS